MTKRSTCLAVVRFIVVLAIGFVLATIIDPGLHFNSALAAQAVNAVLPIILLLIMWGITGRAWLGILFEIVLLVALRYAELLKTMYLHTDVVYADLTVLGSLMNDPHLIFGFIHPSAMHIVIAGIIIVAAVLPGWFLRHRRGADWKFRLSCLALAVAGLVTIGTLRAPDVIHALHWQVYQQAFGVNDVGVAGNILLGRMTARDVDRKPSITAEKAFWLEPAVKKQLTKIDVNGTGIRPDIVILQSESMFEPSQLNGFANTPVLKHLAQQQPDLAGNLHVPVFGGRTLQTEFEVLTGSPLSFYPGAMFAYYGIIKHRFAALPYVLDQHGYRTIAIHPNHRGFWRRGVVFPEMGFQSFQNINSFRYPQDFSKRGFVSDYSLMRGILAELDASNRPTFIMAISINNHGPWGKHAPKNDAGLGLPSKVHGEARKALADYVEHATDEDNAYNFLLKALARRHRPTVVVTYGDHLPALPSVYKQLGFKDGLAPPKHLPPYRIWANFSMPKPPAITSAYLLQGWLMHIAGLPLDGHVLANYLAGAVKHDPNVSAKVKKRVMHEYANIAAANVYKLTPPIRNAHTVFVDYDHALGMLHAHRTQQSTSVHEKYRELHFTPKPDKPAHADYNFNGEIASLSLRPFLSYPLRSCKSTGTNNAHATLRVTADGRDLYSVPLVPKGFRLTTLNVQGVKHLSITVAAPSDAAATDSCAEVTIKIPQMQCFSGSCTDPGPPLPAQSLARLPSRTLSSDPMLGDITHLESMTPLARRQIAGKLANVHWMLSHQLSANSGAAPFKVQPDGRLFMPPGRGNDDAWIDVDVSGLNQIVLAPRINRLNKHCLSIDSPARRVGIAKLSVLLDGKPLVTPVTVDPAFRNKLALNVKNGHTLRINVAKGSSVNWCDWFSVGFPSLKGPAAPPQKSLKTTSARETEAAASH